MCIQNRQVAGLLLQVPAAALPRAWSEASHGSARFDVQKAVSSAFKAPPAAASRNGVRTRIQATSPMARVWGGAQVTGKLAHGPLNQSLMLSRTRGGSVTMKAGACQIACVPRLEIAFGRRAGNRGQIVAITKPAAITGSNASSAVALARRLPPGTKNGLAGSGGLLRHDDQRAGGATEDRTDHGVRPWVPPVPMRSFHHNGSSGI
jgi:hypothetical protein